jgi:hypothetical protein
MNYCDHEDNCECKPEKKEHKSKSHETVTILKCGTSTGSAPLSCNGPALAGVGGGGGYGFQPVEQATVVLDTSELINPTIKIDFSSLISFKTSSDDNFFLKLAFKLSKVCGGSHIPLGTWTFEEASSDYGPRDAQVNGGGGYCGYVKETEAFCFSWCECDDCPDCCRYIVELVDQQCYNIDFANISNISLTAMAVGMKNRRY